MLGGAGGGGVVSMLGWVAPCGGDKVAFKEKGTASQFSQKPCGQGKKHGVSSLLKIYSRG